MIIDLSTMRYLINILLISKTYPLDIYHMSYEPISHIYLMSIMKYVTNMIFSRVLINVNSIIIEFNTMRYLIEERQTKSNFSWNTYELKQL